MTTLTEIWFGIVAALLISCCPSAGGQPSPAGNSSPASDPALVAAPAGSASAAGVIHVVSATYGPSCRAPIGNQTKQVASECDGKSACRYVADNRFGDPAFGCSKDFLVQWRCGDDAAMRSVRHGPVVAEGYEVALSCEGEVLAAAPSLVCATGAPGMESIVSGDCLAGLGARAQPSAPSPQPASPPATSVAMVRLKVVRVSSVAGSQEAPGISGSKCPADGPQLPLMHCIRDELEAVDLQIEHMLASSIATLPDAEVSDEEREQARSSLLAAQGAWQEYREKSCTAARLYLDNGDAGKLEYLVCERRLAEQRLHDFAVFQER